MIERICPHCGKSYINQFGHDYSLCLDRLTQRLAKVLDHLASKLVEAQNDH